MKDELQRMKWIIGAGTFFVFLFFMHHVQFEGSTFAQAEYRIWDVVRAAGMVAYLGFAWSVLFGMLSHWKVFQSKTKALFQFIHQQVGWYAFLFTLVHMFALLSAEYRIYQLFIPFLVEDHVLANAFAILAFYLMIGLVWTSDFIRTQYPKFWRLIHLGAFPAFVLMGVHAMLVGTDAFQWYFWIPNMVCCSLLLIFMILRIPFSKKKKKKRPSISTVPVHESVQSEAILPSAHQS